LISSSSEEECSDSSASLISSLISLMAFSFISPSLSDPELSLSDSAAVMVFPYLSFSLFFSLIIS
jgi:hypothetical protein